MRETLVFVNRQKIIYRWEQNSIWSFEDWSHLFTQNFSSNKIINELILRWWIYFNILSFPTWIQTTLAPELTPLFDKQGWPGEGKHRHTLLQAQSDILVLKASHIFDTLILTLFIKTEFSVDSITHSEFWEVCIKVSCHNFSFIWECFLTFVMRSWDSWCRDIKFLFSLNPFRPTRKS